MEDYKKNKLALKKLWFKSEKERKSDTFLFFKNNKHITVFEAFKKLTRSEGLDFFCGYSCSEYYPKHWR